MSGNPWADIISSSLARGCTVDEVPKEYATSAQIQVDLKLSKYTVNSRMRTLVNTGKIEVKEFKIPVGNTCRNVRHYKIIK